VETQVLERYAPAHVVANREGEIVQYSGKTGKYL
jgi:two-component system CheB/CheR fusion protein